MNVRALRVARGWAVGVFATALAAMSHALAGGGTPSALALVVGAVFGGMLGTFALSSRPSLPRLAIAVGVTQLAFHVLFSTLGAAAPVTGSDHHAMAALELAAPAHAHVDTPLMWLSHTAAALVTLALLGGAERAAWRLLSEFARLVVSRFGRPVPVPVRTRPRPAVRTSTAPAVLTSVLLDPAVSRRGPPSSVAF